MRSHFRLLLPAHGIALAIGLLAFVPASVAAAELKPGDIELAVTPDGHVWSANIGGVSRFQGWFYRTRLADGATKVADHNMALGIATDPQGGLVIAGCETVSRDCWRRFVKRVPGQRLYVDGGRIAVVPATVTPVHRSTWGSLKSLYR